MLLAITRFPGAATTGPPAPAVRPSGACITCIGGGAAFTVSFGSATVRSRGRIAFAELLIPGGSGNGPGSGFAGICRRRSSDPTSNTRRGFGGAGATIVIDGSGIFDSRAVSVRTIGGCKITTSAFSVRSARGGGGVNARTGAFGGPGVTICSDATGSFAASVRKDGGAAISDCARCAGARSGGGVNAFGGVFGGPGIVICIVAAGSFAAAVRISGGAAISPGAAAARARSGGAVNARGAGFGAPESGPGAGDAAAAAAAGAGAGRSGAGAPNAGRGTARRSSVIST